MEELKGRYNWVFCDGDLPPAGSKEPFGHEALMITNLYEQDAHLDFEILFEDRDPDSNITLTLKAKRTICIRLDKPFGDQQYKLPFGQYALHLHSDVPVAACFGRLDVRQSNMAYYTVPGFSF